MKRKAWFIITGLVLIAGISFAAFSFFSHRGSGVLAVSELKSKANSLQNQQLWVKGKVASGSINWDDKTRVIRFALIDDRESLNILYQGTLPDNFKPGADLEVQGSYRSDGIFEAQSFGRPASFCAICHG